MTTKLYITVPDDLIEEIDLNAKTLGASRAVFLRMAVIAGSKAIMRSMSPEKTFSLEQWAKLFELTGKNEAKNE
jgi:hypothetical protein